ncbi:uncharacterized protein ACJ7VT_006962 isoform 1-T2 [Polymixia lowei]
MNSDQPPPYGPPPPVGPLAPGFPTGFSSQPAVFPSQPYQPSYPPYQGAPGPYPNQPGYQGYQSGPPGPQYGWDGAKEHLYGEPPKNPVYLVGESSGAQGRGRGGVSGMEACLGACWTALCCCCLWDMLT